MDIDKKIEEITTRFTELLKKKEKITFKDNYDYNSLLRNLEKRQDTSKDNISKLEEVDFSN